MGVGNSQDSVFSVLLGGLPALLLSWEPGGGGGHWLLFAWAWAGAGDRGPGPRRLAEGEGAERKGQQIGRRQREHALEPWTPWRQKARQILTNTSWELWAQQAWRETERPDSERDHGHSNRLFHCKSSASLTCPPPHVCQTVFQYLARDCGHQKCGCLPPTSQLVGAWARLEPWPCHSLPSTPSSIQAPDQPIRGDCECLLLPSTCSLNTFDTSTRQGFSECPKEPKAWCLLCTEAGLGNHH